jgi:hypothetical protein
LACLHSFSHISLLPATFFSSYVPHGNKQKK